MKSIFKLLLFWSLTNQNFSVMSQSLPIISYNEINKFTINEPIIPLMPNNIGGVINGVMVSTLAGNGIIGSQDGTGSSASFYAPYGMTIDITGNILVADNYNHKIRKITPSGVVSTFAGTGIPGNINGNALASKFNYPHFIIMGTGGNFYVTDASNHIIRKITPSGIVSTYAGSGIRGFGDGLAEDACFNGPSSIVFDKAENMYVGDLINNNIRKITPSGIVTTLAGSGITGSNDGTGITATFTSISGLAIDYNGNLYAADKDRIRKITPTGVVTTFAQNLLGIFDLVFDKESNLIITNITDNKIKRISPNGIISDFAGDGENDSDDGPGTSASIYGPCGIVMDNFGDFYVSSLKNTIRKLEVNKGTYSISPTLPDGLMLDPVSGVISGKPVKLSPETVYTVTGENKHGSSVFNIKIMIHDKPPTISYISPPEFFLDEMITPLYPVSTGGEITAFNIIPDLPEGLVFDPISGYISGIPKIISAKTLYTISASNTGGTSNFEIEIAVKTLTTGYGELGVSEAITPNGDGINDTWVIKNIESYKNSIVKVFNRWGSQVFVSKNYQNDWNGHYKNHSQSLPESSSYYYQIDIDGNGSPEKEGWIYITK